ncbi:MAG: Tad domain-containing protein [Selenomonadaceae bacterium]|nr:Tad domain-containing protein [Selenomonadaceae bacterium]
MCKEINRRGQVMLFYALLIPVLILFVGVGLDLGWYYLNVSRLQNAADAAALAGAQALVKRDNDFQDYYIVSLDSNVVPEDFDDYESVFSNTFDGNHHYQR